MSLEIEISIAPNTVSVPVSSISGIPGPAGADGAVGPAGADGAVGPAGADGAVGPAGADGAVGPAGADGAVGPAATAYNGDNNGQIQWKASATANSGYSFRMGGAEILLKGKEHTSFIFSFPNSGTASNTRAGFLDAASVPTAPVDSAMFTFVGNGATVDVSANCSSNSTFTTTSMGSVSLDTLYHYRITLNANATSVLFEIYTMAGVLVTSTAITTNIPTASGRNTSHAVQSWHTTGSANYVLLVLDYIDVHFPGRRRGAL